MIWRLGITVTNDRFLLSGHRLPPAIDQLGVASATGVQAFGVEPKMFVFIRSLEVKVLLEG